MKWERLECCNKTVCLYGKNTEVFKYRLCLKEEGTGSYQISGFAFGERLFETGWLSIPIAATQSDVEDLANLYIRQFFISNFP